MQVLVVDDDPNQIRTWSDLAPARDKNISIISARGVEDALKIAESTQVDVAVIDLKIPVSETASDEADDHGYSLLSRLRKILPGTPLLLCTGYASVPVARKTYAEFTGRGSPFGGPESTLFELFEKQHLQECLARVLDLSADCAALANVELDPGPTRVNLSACEKRVLKAAARHLQSVRADVRELSGGLSGSRAFSFTAIDDKGRRRALAIAKIGLLDSIDAEAFAYSQRISGMLRGGSYAALICRMSPAGSRLAGVFYRLANGDGSAPPVSLFDVVRHSAAQLDGVIQKIADACRPWTDGFSHARLSIGDVRRKLVSDEKLSKADGDFFAEVQEAEARLINLRLCTQHCDLHGENVLVSQANEPMLIDYGSIAEAPAGLDAVTLELSLIGHESGRRLVTGWPSVEIASKWDDLATFSATAPDDRVRSLLLACRAWATAVAGGYNAVAAAAYAYSARQLTYQDVDHSVARAVARACLRRLRENE